MVTVRDRGYRSFRFSACLRKLAALNDDFRRNRNKRPGEDVVTRRIIAKAPTRPVIETVRMPTGGEGGRRCLECLRLLRGKAVSFRTCWRRAS